MRRTKCYLVLFLAASCYAVRAAQPGPGATISSPNATPGGGNSDPNSTNIFEEINKELRYARNTQHPEGFGPVGARQASICPICKQPLYKHADPNFQCIPVDSDGNQRKMLHIQTRAAQCPVCGKALNGALPGNFNDNGGRDRDFCEHSVGRYTVHSRVWVCPSCGYAALYDNFNTSLDGKPIDEATKQYVRDNLTEPMRKRMFDIVGITPKPNQPVPDELLEFGTYVPQNDIPDWVKYENALKIYERMKPPRGFLATLYLEAAHANRREVCSEVSVPGLHNASQVALGRSIRVVNSYLQNQCMTIRRRQGAAILDPTKMETDPDILAQACAEIVRLGEQNYATAQTAADPQPQQQHPEHFFSTGDMFVLNLRYAGVLDRLGRLDDAERMLRRAASYIPDKPSGLSDAENTQAAQDYYAGQVKLIRRVVDDRLACLQREKEYLFNAAKFNMVAIKLKEVQFAGEAPNPEQAKAAILDAAPTAYLLGELLRRAGEFGAAAAWFDAANSVIAHRLAVLDQNGQNPQHQTASDQDALNAKRERWMLLRDWVKEQRALIKNAPTVDPNVMEAINIVLQAEGVTMKPVPVASTDSSDKEIKQTAAAPESTPAAPKSGKIKTRDELYNVYYKALIAYRSAKGKNADTPADLVRGGFLSREDSCQDDKGKVFCPETGDKLGYARTWDKGDKSAAIMWSSTNPKSKRLYADGQIRSGDGK